METTGISQADIKSKKEFWMRTIEEQQKSGLSMQAFCREKAVCYSTFKNWYYRLSKHVPSKHTRKSSLQWVPVDVTSSRPPVVSEKIEVTEVHVKIHLPSTLPEALLTHLLHVWRGTLS